jgi:hypothetical protein
VGASRVAVTSPIFSDVAAFRVGAWRMLRKPAG